ncbi:hypothetical protein E1162_09435 [Rhodobacteraceae bacterium RKSG542]|uniref:hypothetical protein n=1 Tax=Pseudovibrio flavus TaxID=2529854 RepID=UPI0012BD610A|nr:hypothetical protein [Pseudovibrio flavus]MTI17459.1 hypothetical protein [Pseudovibrio flavus]
MTETVIRIERIEPRGDVSEEPTYGTKGYCLGNPKFGPTKHHVKNAVYVKTFEEVAELVSAGFSLRMTGKGKRPSLVSPKGLRIVRG